MSKNCAPETFRTPRQGPCSSFAGAKVQQFRKPPKLINNFFQKNCIHNTPYIILIYARETILSLLEIMTSPLFSPVKRSYKNKPKPIYPDQKQRNDTFLSDLRHFISHI